MTTQNIALVTGANKGIGLQTVGELAARGWTVWLGSRDEEAGLAAAAGLADLPGEVHVVQLDVTDDASVDRAAKTVDAAHGRLDVLVNNAGISGRRATVEETTPADFLPVYGVNLLGPVRVTTAFLPLLRRSSAARLVMVSSGMGSFGITTDPGRVESTIWGLAYPSSKAALNMVTSQYAKALPEVRVVAVDPGYTATALNGFSGTQTIAEGADVVVQACTRDDLAGPFVGRHGAIAW